MVVIKFCSSSSSLFLVCPTHFLPAHYPWHWRFQWRHRVDTSHTCQVDWRQRRALFPPFSLFLSLSLVPLWIPACRILFHCSPHHSQTLMLVNQIDCQQKGMWHLVCQGAPCMVHSWVAVCFAFLSNVLRMMIDQIFWYVWGVLWDLSFWGFIWNWASNVVWRRI